MSVSNLKIHVKRGRIYSLLGRNGAGKTILISSHILSEISLLADDIGIIDRGILLEEENLKELKKERKVYPFHRFGCKKGHTIYWQSVPNKKYADCRQLPPASVWDIFAGRID